MASIPPGISREHIIAAIEGYDPETRYGFGGSRDYDLIYEGKAYPPKAIVGGAAQLLTGEPTGPDDFSSGVGPGQAVSLLRNLGFEVVQKGLVPTSAQPAASWIFQGRPDQYDLRSALESLTELSWLVRRYRDEIHVGDRVYLWESGSDGGILAEARVLTEPAELTEREDERAYWIQPDEFEGPRLRVRLVVERVLSRPLRRDEMGENPKLADLLILRMASGTNFPVRPDQDRELQAMIDADGVLPSPSPDREMPGREPSFGGAHQPEWTTDERILALDVYLRHGLAGEHDPAVVELSEALRSLPIHDPRPTSASFRNPHGVYWKLTCFAALDPDHTGGASNYTRGDEEVWQQYHQDPETVARLASEIRAASDFPVVSNTRGSTEPGQPTVTRAAGTAYVRANEQVETDTPAPFAIDPNVVDRGRQGHAKTQNALAAHIESLGLEPLSPTASGPDFDIAWKEGSVVWVAEVKSLTDSNETGQIRLAIGQVLDYQDQFRRLQEVEVRAVIALERRPNVGRWVDLCAHHDIVLTWPEAFAEDIV